MRFCLLVMSLLLVPVTLWAQEDPGVRLAALVQDQADAEQAKQQVDAGCAGAWDDVRQYIGSIDNPLAPRDATCSAHVADTGQRLAGFAACSDAWFNAYDKAHATYRQCLTDQTRVSDALVAIHRTRLELDRQARSVVRANAYVPSEAIGTRGWLGVRYSSISAKTMAQFSLPNRQGVLISRVSEASPAHKAGLRPNDVVLALDDAQVPDRRAFSAMTKDLQAGQIIVLDVLRSGQRRLVYVAVEPR